MHRDAVLMQMDPIDANTWSSNWAWAVPLIVLCVVIHASGLALMNERVGRVMDTVERRGLMRRFAVVMSIITVAATALHGFEAVIWAFAFRVLGASPDNKTAMLYSISAMTTYGHANIFLKPHWQMMGALEALNGMLLFGLTTAFMFAMIQRIWPSADSG